jgi:TIR domain
MARDLIPLGVRIALRNAVGGWGPYAVREIHDLFNSCGFLERAEDVEDAGGARRTTAEEYQARIDFASPDQARRYLELVDEVLEHYPEDAAEPDPVGTKLRRELRRAGIERGPSGRLELQEAAAEAAQALDAATEDIWRPDRIRVFMSHTSEHKADVGRLANELNRFAFSCFVAHDAIEPSRQWQEVIELALRTCDVLVAYVTPDFNASRWTDQEVGWALGRGVIVIPLKAGTDPYGFFGAYQAVALGKDQRTWEVAVAVTRAIAVAIFRRQRPGAAALVGPMTDAVVDAFCLSGSFESTRRRFELLTLVPRDAWTVEHLTRLERAIEENGQIREAVLPDRQAAPDAARELLGKLRGATSRA